MRPMPKTAKAIQAGVYNVLYDYHPAMARGVVAEPGFCLVSKAGGLFTDEQYAEALDKLPWPVTIGFGEISIVIRPA
jgi:hypothetical protein